MKNVIPTTAFTLLLTSAILFGATKKSSSGSRDTTYPPVMPDAKAEIYKAVGDAKLKLYIFNPKNHSASDRRPAIVFFFGGGWTKGSPQQFEKHCQHFSSRGMVAIAADYRVASRHNVKPSECVADAKSAMRWVRTNAVRMGIDPEKIVAGGGSAGGHLAAAIALLKDFDEPGEDTSTSPVPNALVLFNPALVLAPLDGNTFNRSSERIRAERFGPAPERLSPAHHVVKGAPPTIIFHGRADQTVPFETIEAFASLMKKAGNRCDVSGFDGQQHGFFNYRPGNTRFYDETVKQADAFLVSLGYLEKANGKKE